MNDVPLIVMTLTEETLGHHYIRVCFSNVAGEPWMSLYELDEDGTVLRHAQMYAEGSRFSPEQVMICAPVDPACLLSHEGAQRLERRDFDSIWADFALDRAFYRMLPDFDRPCSGSTRLGTQELRLLWMPSADAPPGWTCVPGFTRLFVEGGAQNARRVGAAAFCDAQFEWNVINRAAA